MDTKTICLIIYGCGGVVGLVAFFVNSKRGGRNDELTIGGIVQLFFLFTMFAPITIIISLWYLLSLLPVWRIKI